MRNCALVVRVSTDQQARNPEGSLANQLQRLRGHIDYKRTACGEEWQESETYILKAVSGKDSLRSPEFARLFVDIKAGRINTILCTALDRICRSVKDFLSFFEFLNTHGVEFVCLKQNYDTTSPQGWLFITIMMALAQFEREHTAERNRDTSLARAERGLWNGGYLFGYQFQPDRKGHLVPCERESAIVNLVFDLYLETGSIAQTVEALKERGVRREAYTSRRGKDHAAKALTWSQVRWMLNNHAYIGLKEVNKKQRGEGNSQASPARQYRRVKAQWEPIVDEKKFHAVQELLLLNNHAKTNQVKQVRQVYLFNGGLLWCGECGREMEGCSGTGRRGGRYFYYRCPNKECRLRIPAGTLESAVFDRTRELALSPELLPAIVKKTNQQLLADLPALQKQRRLIEKELKAVCHSAEVLLDGLDDSSVAAKRFVQEKLNKLAERRGELEQGLIRIEQELASAKSEEISVGQVRQALSQIDKVVEGLPPYKRKKLLRLVLHRAELTRTSLRLGYYGRPGAQQSIDAVVKGNEPAIGAGFAQTSTWLRERDLNPQPSG